MADYENLLDSIDAVIKSNNRREITGQILQNTLHQMVGSLGENYQLAGFATPTLDPNSPDQNVFYITDEAGVYTNFDNITLGAGLSFLMWKNEEWTSKTLDVVTADWVDEHYVSKAFLRKVFQFFDEDGVEIFPNDTESVVDNIKAMCGLWTNEYLSALGLGEGSTIPTTLAALNDVTITNPQDGQALVYDAASLHWVNATIQSGVDMSVVWAALAGSTNEQINISHLTSALSDYVTATSLATTLQSYVTTSALATELANYASQNWVETNYVSKAFFNSLFEAQDVNGNAITPNNSGQTTIDRLKILVGAYTEQYLSALGLSSGGGGGGSSTLAGLNDVTITNPQDGQALIYDAQSSHWVNGAAISMSAVWTALAAATSEQINSSHLTSALSGYVTTSALASELANYVTTSSLATTLADYVTTSALATTLEDYGSKTWIDNNYVSKAFFNRLFQAFAPLAEGQTEPTQVEPNDTTTTIDNIKAMFGLWTEQYLSALGLSAGGGHTIGVLNDLNDVTITNPQTNQVLRYNGTQWVNDTAPSGATALSGLTDVAISSLADKDLLQWDYASGEWQNVTLSSALTGYATTSQLASYLPLSGGTLYAAGADTPLEIKSATTDAYIRFKDKDGTTLGYLGVSASKKPIFYIGGNEEIALKSAIPTNNNQLTNGAGYITSRGSCAYASSAGSASRTPLVSIDNSISYGRSGMQFAQNEGKVGTDPTIFQNPANDWYSHIIMNHGNSRGYYVDLAFCFFSDDFRFRRVVAGSGTSWGSFITSSNIGSQSVSYASSAGAVAWENVTGKPSVITTDTAQTISGQKTFNTSTNTVPVWITRSGSTAEGMSIGVEDETVTFKHYQDEKQSNFYFVGQWTDMEGGGGAAAGSKYILFTLNSTTAAISINGNNVLHSGNSSVSKSGDTLTVNINGTTQSLTNTNTTYSANNGVGLSGTTFYNSGVRAATINGNYLRVNTNGIDADLTIPYATNAGSASSATNATYATYDSSGYTIANTTWVGNNYLHLNGGTISGGNNFRPLVVGGTYSGITEIGIMNRNTVYSGFGYNNGYTFMGREDGGNYPKIALRHSDGAMVYSPDNFNSIKMYVTSSGDIVASGGVSALSDIRHKDILGDTTIKVDDIARMRSVAYRWIDGRNDTATHVGSIAQDWQQILPEVVLRANNDEGTLSLQYGVAALISSITIARKVVNHEERIKALEKENADLKQAYSFIKNAYDYLKMDYENLKLKIA